MISITITRTLIWHRGLRKLWNVYKWACDVVHYSSFSWQAGLL